MARAIKSLFISTVEFLAFVALMVVCILGGVALMGG